MTRVLGISGSLRRDSINRRLLRAAGHHLPSGVELVELDPALLKAVPPYDQDDDHDDVDATVTALRQAIAQADAVLFATPEYNGSVPGVLKNAIDWASRPPEQPFDGKPIGVMGASMGTHGTSRAQYHLRQCFIFLNGLVMTIPEVMIPQAQNKFVADRTLNDQATRDFITAHLAALKAWVLRLI